MVVKDADNYVYTRKKHPGSAILAAEEPPGAQFWLRKNPGGAILAAEEPQGRNFGCGRTLRARGHTPLIFDA